MALRDVRYFVCQDAGEFILTARGIQQAGVNTDVAAGQRECVDPGVFHHEKREAVIAFVGLGGNFATNFIDVFGDQWVFNNCPGRSDVTHDRPPDLGFGVSG